MTLPRSVSLHDACLTHTTRMKHAIRHVRQMVSIVPTPATHTRLERHSHKKEEQRDKTAEQEAEQKPERRKRLKNTPQSCSNTRTVVRTALRITGTTSLGAGEVNADSVERCACRVRGVV